MNEEILAKARAAKSPEELLELAHENGMSEFTEENAKGYFEAMHKSGELSDEEMDVSAGGCGQIRSGGRIVVTHLNSCNNFVCKDCGRNYTETRRHWEDCHGYFLQEGDCSNQLFCCNCKFFIYEKGLWLCNNPAHNNE